MFHLSVAQYNLKEKKKKKKKMKMYLYINPNAKGINCQAPLGLPTNCTLYYILHQLWHISPDNGNIVK